MNQDELKRYAASKQIPLGTAEKDYVLSVVLMQLQKSKYANNFIFKGGTAIKKVYFPEARFSVDLDFNFFDITSHDLVNEISELYNGKNILETSFKEAKETETSDTKVLLNIPYKAQLSHLDNVRLDFTFKEPILTRPHSWTPKDDYDVTRRMTCEHLSVRIVDQGGYVEQFFSCYLGRFSAGSGKNRRKCLDCLMEAPRRSEPLPSAFRAMSPEEILSEKVRACIMRRRPRDLYDMWFLQSKNIKMDHKMIVEKLRLYKEFKEVIPNLKEIKERLTQIKPEWDRDLSVLVPSKSYPDFQETLENTMSSLKKCGWKE